MHAQAERRAVELAIREVSGWRRRNQLQNTVPSETVSSGQVAWNRRPETTSS